MKIISINFRVTADGNCLYNAVSIYLCGDERLHLVLRLLTTIELYTNWKYHNQELDRIIAGQNKLGIIRSMFHFFSTDVLTSEGDMNNVFQLEAITNCNPGTFSSLVCVIALSSVTNFIYQSNQSIHPGKISRYFHCSLVCFVQRTPVKMLP